jgi:transglutaminase-like putative cysteine protease
MPDWLRRYAMPREGWLALALLFVMLLSLGWSVQKAEWLDQLEYIIPVAFYAVMLGALLGLTPLSVVAVLPIAALAGTAIVLWTVGGEYFPDLSQGARLMALRQEGLDFARIVLDRGYAPHLTPYAMGLGVVMWTTSFIAGYTIYRHHRVLDAILLVGAALIANMSATFADLFGYLVLFMLAALLLWLRAALIGREEAWQRRRVNENTEVPAAIMRSGIVFIAGSIVLAWVLTTVAVAAPLTAVWNNLDGAWSDLRDRLDGLFGGLSNPDSRLGGTFFGSGFRISGDWVSRDEPVLTLAAARAYYLRTGAYDIYTGHGFDRTPGGERQVAAGQPLFPDYTPERPTREDAFALETIDVQMHQSVGRSLFTPGFPTQAFAPMVVVEPDEQPFIGALQAASAIAPGEGYSITALISQATEAQLNSAGTNYPEEILDYYLGTDGVTDRTRALAEEILTAAGAETPYQRAKALADFLRGHESFRYSTSAPFPDDPDRDFVDFFLFDPNGRIGYCEYYATTMVVMARSIGLPARVAVGFAPGERVDDLAEGDGGVFLVREKNAHAWAEVYFPGFGWQIFESTKSISPVIRRAGDPLPPTSSGGAQASLPPQFEPGDPGEHFALPSFEVVPGGIRPGDTEAPDEERGGNLLVITGIVVVVGVIAFWRWRNTRRRLRLLAPGERQWRRLTLAADRAGVAQRPSETTYEYAGWLEEQIPRRRPEIRTIAEGKVWQSYSGHGISGEAIARIEAAWKRLQLPLVWLTLRRRLRALIPGR